MTKKIFERKIQNFTLSTTLYANLNLKKKFCLYQITVFPCSIHIRLGVSYGNRILLYLIRILKGEGNDKKNFRPENSKLHSINNIVRKFKFKKKFCLYQITVFPCSIHIRLGVSYGNRIRVYLMASLKVEGRDKKNFQTEKSKLQSINYIVRKLKYKNKFCLNQRTVFPCFIWHGTILYGTILNLKFASPSCKQGSANPNKSANLNMPVHHYLILIYCPFIYYECSSCFCPATNYPCYVDTQLSLNSNLIIYSVLTNNKKIFNFKTNHPNPDSDCHGNMPVVSVEGSGWDAGQCGPYVCWSWRHGLVTTGIHAVYLLHVRPDIKKTSVTLKTCNHYSYSQAAIVSERSNQSVPSNFAIFIQSKSVDTQQEDCKSRVKSPLQGKLYSLSLNYSKYSEDSEYTIVDRLRRVVQCLEHIRRGTGTPAEKLVCVGTGTGIRMGTAAVVAKFAILAEFAIFLVRYRQCLERFWHEKMKIPFSTKIHYNIHHIVHYIVIRIVEKRFRIMFKITLISLIPCLMCIRMGRAVRNLAESFEKFTVLVVILIINSLFISINLIFYLTCLVYLFYSFYFRNLKVNHCHVELFKKGSEKIRHSKSDPHFSATTVVGFLTIYSFIYLLKVTYLFGFLTIYSLNYLLKVTYLTVDLPFQGGIYLHLKKFIFGHFYTFGCF